MNWWTSLSKVSRAGAGVLEHTNRLTGATRVRHVVELGDPIRRQVVGTHGITCTDPGRVSELPVV